MKNLYTTKSSARKSDAVSGHTSKPYNSTGKHLLLITCKATSSEAVWTKNFRQAPNFPPISGGGQLQIKFKSACHDV